jgi:hypothetical protein
VSTAAEFVISLQDRMSGPANASTAALERLAAAQIRTATAAARLAGVEVSSSIRNQAAAESAAAAAANRDALAQVKLAQAESQAAAAAVRLGQAQERAAAQSAKLAAGVKPVGGAAKEGASSLEEMQGVLRSVGGAARFVDGPLGKVVRLLGKGGLVGAAVAAIAILVVLGVKLVELAADLAKFAFESANAARAMGLLNTAAAGSAKESANLEAAIAHVAATTPLAKAKIAELGRALETAGFKGKSLADSLEAVAIVTSAMGDTAGGALDTLIKKMGEAKKEGGNLALTQKELANTGLDLKDVAKQLAQSMHISVAAAEAALKGGKVKLEDAVDAINKATKAKFGDTIAAQMLDLGVQFAKLKENIADLFAKIDLKPLLAALKDLLSFFDKGTATGQALRAVLTQVFSGIAKAIASALPYVKAFFKGALIAGLELYIVGLKIRNAIAEMFGGDSVSKAEAMKKALQAGKVIVYALATAFVYAGAVAYFAFMVASAPIRWLISIVMVAVGVVSKVGQAFSRLAGWIRGVNLRGAASAMIDGLIGGISAKIGSVVATMKGLGLAAASALKSALGIASPSRVMIEAGKNTAGGFGAGVDKGTPDAQKNVVALGDARPGAGKGANANGAGKSITFSNCTFDGTSEDRILGIVKRAFDVESGAMDEMMAPA